MVQGYYTLEEAARILGMGSEELSQMAQKREVRSFADRGTWRFRTQDIEELARRRGLGSNPDLPLGEAAQPKPHDSPAPKKKDPSGSDEGVFTFGLGDSSDQVEIGQEIISESPSGAKSGSKSGGRGSGPKSPPPKPGSDSDVRLVADGSGVGYQIAADSGVVLTPEDSSSTKLDPKKQKPKVDSGVRLVPDSDSDVKIVPDSTDDVAATGGARKSGSDSDIRLEAGAPPSTARGRQAKPEDSFLTEEIDLDAELRAAEEAARARKAPSGVKGPSAPPGAPAKKESSPESSSDFDLGIDSGSSIEIDSGDLKKKSEEVPLGEAPAPSTQASDSGINLQEPADSGISLEQGGDSSEEIEFELSLDAESTPKPARASPNVDSSSEFELTLEDSARLAPLDSGEKAPASGEDKDIFETDFEVPALEDESGSQVAALDDSDTDLESSDFDLALGEEDAAASEESGSQVVALEDEQDVDEGAATVARPRKGGDAAVEEEAGEMLGEEELEEEEMLVGARPAVAAAPADWGLFAPITLCVSVFIMLFGVLPMSWELLHSMWGYRQPGMVSSPVIKTIGPLFGVDSKDLEK